MTIKNERYISYEEDVTICKECKFAEKYVYRPKYNNWYLRCTRHTKRQIDVVTGMTRVLGHFVCCEVNDGHCKYWEQKEE